MPCTRRDQYGNGRGGREGGLQGEAERVRHALEHRARGHVALDAELGAEELVAVDGRLDGQIGVQPEGLVLDLEAQGLVRALRDGVRELLVPDVVVRAQLQRGEGRGRGRERGVTVSWSRSAGARRAYKVGKDQDFDEPRRSRGGHRSRSMLDSGGCFVCGRGWRNAGRSRAISGAVRQGEC